MSAFLAVFRHGIRSYWKDRRTILLGILTPILLFLIFTLIFSGKKEAMLSLNVGWVDQDKSPVSQRLRELAESGGTIKTMILELHEENAKKLIQNGKLGLAVVISKGFSDQLVRFKNWQNTYVQIYYDSTSALQANILKGLLTKAGFLLTSETWSSPENQKNLAANQNLDPHWKKFVLNLGNAFGESRKFMETFRKQNKASNLSESFLPMAAIQIQGLKKMNALVAQQMAGVAIMFLLFSVARAGSILLEEKSAGTLKRILSAPLSMKGLLLGKLFSVSTNGTIQVSLICLVGWTIFQIPIFNSPFPLLLLIFVTALCAASFGLFFAAFCQTTEQVHAQATLLILTMSLIGGNMVPKFLLPLWAQKLSIVTPNGWAMEGFLNILVRNQGIAGLFPHLFVLIGMAGLLLGLTFLLVPKRLYE